MRALLRAAIDCSTRSSRWKPLKIGRRIAARIDHGFFVKLKGYWLFALRIAASSAAVNDELHGCGESPAPERAKLSARQLS